VARVALGVWKNAKTTTKKPQKTARKYKSKQKIGDKEKSNHL
jgi:hypothetical protein